MKHLYLFIFLLFVIPRWSVFSQPQHDIQINLGATGGVHYKGLQPGIFYHTFWDYEVNNTFNATTPAKSLNCIRESKFHSESWKYSTSFSDILNKMKTTGLKSWLLHVSQYTDRVVVKFNGMPYWLSSSTDTSTLYDKSWKKYQTYPPASYVVYDQIIRQVVDTIESWGIHPYYEIWNEPDGEYWSGTDAQLLELYKHTALAIKQADPLAKVGGFGMQIWWRSANPVNDNSQNYFSDDFYGNVEDTVAEHYSILYDLLDSVINNWGSLNIPLDFISYHQFNWHSHEIVMTARQLRNEMSSLGYCHPDSTCSGRRYPELYVSEWQTTYSFQERVFQAPLYLRHYMNFREADIDFHSIAAISDFTQDTANAFINEWGLITLDGLVKPAHSMQLLMNGVTRKSTEVPVQSSEGVNSIASIKGDTLKILFANYVLPYLWFADNYWRQGYEAYTRLLYHPTSIYSKTDFIYAGYTSAYWNGTTSGGWGNIDSIFMGLKQPLASSPASMQNLLNAARQKFIQDSIATINYHQVNIHMPWNTDTLMAYMVVMDSKKNNIVFLYDSLRFAGYSHSRAIDSLQSCYFAGGCYGLSYDVDTISITDTIATLTLKPSSVVFMVIPGIDTTWLSQKEFMPGNMKAVFYPNPMKDQAFIEFENSEHYPLWLQIYDSQGKLCREISDTKGSEKITIDKNTLPGGFYFYILYKNNQPAHSGKFIITKM